VDHVPDPLLLKNSGSAGYRTRTFESVARNSDHGPVRVRVRVTLRLTVSQSVSLGVEPNVGLLTRDIFFFFFKVTVLS
jgi:hypothetical protein